MAKAQTDWHPALAAARRGELTPARETRDRSQRTTLDDYFFARCLTEAPDHGPDQFIEATFLLSSACNSSPLNPLFVQTFALALARRGDAKSRRDAAELWETRGLPHDLDLLAQTTLLLEMDLRPLPKEPPTPAREWPEGLPRPKGAGEEAQEERDKVTLLDAENMSQTRAGDSAQAKSEGKPVGQRTLNRLEKMFFKHQLTEIINEVETLLERGHENAELHLVAGLSAEEAGLMARARAHLTRCLAMEPMLHMARTGLGRAYWRLGWNELAMETWRSLPVEGPFDHGRFYHLGLGEEAAGRRAEALTAMEVTLAKYYQDARHFYIKRAFERWKADAESRAWRRG